MIVHSFWRRLLHEPRAVISLSVLSVIVLCALGANFYPVSPVEQDLMAVLQPPTLGIPGHEGVHLLGTDGLGRDLAARLLHGARVSLLVGSAAILLAGFLGTLLGLLAGYFGGWIDRIVSRLVDTLLSLPFIVLAIAVIGVVGPNLLNLVLIMGCTGWVSFARLVRGRVLELRHAEFVEAIRALGGSTPRILFRHLLPGVLPLALVEANVGVAVMILSEAALSFLGLGIQPPTPSWGGIINDGQLYIWTAWWISALPGVVLAATIFSVNTLGDVVRDILDPQVQS